MRGTYEIPIMATSAYRHLLRATRIAFQNDNPVREAARYNVRKAFRDNDSLDPDSPECAAALEHAADISKFLIKNVVQGQKVENVEGESPRYKLRIHEHTELGDNNTIKNPHGGTVVIDRPCSGQ